jgi:hypothetical protein
VGRGRSKAGLATPMRARVARLGRRAATRSHSRSSACPLTRTLGSFRLLFAYSLACIHTVIMVEGLGTNGHSQPSLAGDTSSPARLRIIIGMSKNEIRALNDTIEAKNRALIASQAPNADQSVTGVESLYPSSAPLGAGALREVLQVPRSRREARWAPTRRSSP